MPNGMLMHVLQGVGKATDSPMSVLDKDTQGNLVAHWSLLSEISHPIWEKNYAVER